jgi:hypothetical protein
MCPLLALPHPRLFLLCPFTVLMRLTRQVVCAIKQSISLYVYVWYWPMFIETERYNSYSLWKHPRAQELTYISINIENKPLCSGAQGRPLTLPLNIRLSLKACQGQTHSIRSIYGLTSTESCFQNTKWSESHQVRSMY